MTVTLVLMLAVVVISLFYLAFAWTYHTARHRGWMAGFNEAQQIWKPLADKLIADLNEREQS